MSISREIDRIHLLELTSHDDDDRRTYTTEYKKRQNNSTNGQNETIQWLQWSMRMKHLSTIICYQLQFWNTKTLMIFISWEPSTLRSLHNRHAHTQCIHHDTTDTDIRDGDIITQQNQLFSITEPGNMETHIVRRVLYIHIHTSYK